MPPVLLLKNHATYEELLIDILRPRKNESSLKCLYTDNNSEGIVLVCALSTVSIIVSNAFSKPLIFHLINKSTVYRPPFSNAQLPL